MKNILQGRNQGLWKTLTQHLIVYKHLIIKSIFNYCYDLGYVARKLHLRIVKHLKEVVT